MSTLQQEKNPSVELFWIHPHGNRFVYMYKLADLVF